MWRSQVLLEQNAGVIRARIVSVEVRELPVDARFAAGNSCEKASLIHEPLGSVSAEQVRDVEAVGLNWDAFSCACESVCGVAVAAAAFLAFLKETESNICPARWSDGSSGAFVGFWLA